MRDTLKEMLGRIHDPEQPPVVMGIVNATPDSFFAPSRVPGTPEGVRSALGLVEAGADILDVGGESSRPGAEYVSAREELDRVLPVIRGIREHSDVVISLDTRKAEVARAALEAGADIINDISGFRDDPELLPLVAGTNTPIVIMHMKGSPRTMQVDPRYDDPVSEVRRFLARQVRLALAAGVNPEGIIVDPGIGFGKRLEDNLALLDNLGECSRLEGAPPEGFPVLLGHSRKGFIGTLLEPVLTAEDDSAAGGAPRLIGTLAAGLYGILRGARILRVHDPRETRMAVQVWWSIQQGRQVQ